MRHRVFTYITRADQLLILEYVDGRYARPQIPGGTVKVGELATQAALREAQEETVEYKSGQCSCDGTGGGNSSDEFRRDDIGCEIPDCRAHSHIHRVKQDINGAVQKQHKAVNRHPVNMCAEKILHFRQPADKDCKENNQRTT